MNTALAAQERHPRIVNRGTPMLAIWWVKALAHFGWGFVTGYIVTGTLAILLSAFVSCVS